MTHPVGTGAHGSTFTLALIGVALRAARRFAKVLRNRREVRELHQLDDRALKDIGLMRSDIRAALDLPLRVDPSVHLADVAGGAMRHAGGRTSPATPAGAMKLRRSNAPVLRGSVRCA